VYRSWGKGWYLILELGKLAIYLKCNTIQSIEGLKATDPFQEIQDSTDDSNTKLKYYPELFVGIHGNFSCTDQILFTTIQNARLLFPGCTVWNVL
jgi:hypothetical protein